MGGAYGWSDDGRSDAWAELYRLPLLDGAEPLRHVVVRDAGRPAACASVFPRRPPRVRHQRRHDPGARGRGLGTRATLAVLDIAARHGSPAATLTASRMGRGVYARIGFEEDALLRADLAGLTGRAADRSCDGHDGRMLRIVDNPLSRSLTETRP